MFKTYFRVTLRLFQRQKAYALINGVGLTLGLAATLLILLFVRHELSFDSFHTSADRVYRVYQDLRGARAAEDDWSFTGAPMMDALLSDLPEVEAAGRLYIEPTLVSGGSTGSNARFQEARFAFADASLFDVLAFPLREGDAPTALAQPASVVLTAATAEKYFGTASPIGQTLTLNNRIAVTVTGVFEDLPSNTHLSFDFAVPFDLLKQVYGVPSFDSWWWPSVSTYVRLAENASAETLNASTLPAFVQRYRDAETAAEVVPQLQPVTRIRLYGNPGEGTITNVYVFSAIAFFTLLIACINFVNLATARASRRAKEVALRKVVGASKPQLALRFLSEAYLTTTVSSLLALLTVWAALPVFNSFLGTTLALNLTSGAFWAGFFGLTLGVGLLAGAYPAFVLASQPVLDALRGSGRSTTTAGNARLRQALVVAQFAVSAGLIALAIVVSRQLDYLNDKDLGFDPDGVVVLPTHSSGTILRGFDAFKQELLRDKSIAAVSAVAGVPGMGGAQKMPGSVRGPESSRQEDGRQLPVLYADIDIAAALGLEVEAGRVFDEQFGSDTQQAFLINQTGARTLGLDQPVGRDVEIGYADGGSGYQKTGQIVGVIEDFHAQSLHESVEPLFVTVAENRDLGRLNSLLVRFEAGAETAGLAALEQTWRRTFPTRPFEPTSLRGQLRQAYDGDLRFGRMVGAFALLAIFIACLGLLGVAAYAAQQRRNEIAVRKVLGASPADVVRLLVTDFLKLVVIGYALAVPLAYFAAQRWLGTFAYSVEVGLGTFLIAGLFALVGALTTVSVQTLRAAAIDPARALQAE